MYFNIITLVLEGTQVFLAVLCYVLFVFVSKTLEQESEGLFLLALQQLLKVIFAGYSGACP